MPAPQWRGCSVGTWETCVINLAGQLAAQGTAGLAQGRPPGLGANMAGYINQHRPMSHVYSGILAFDYINFGPYPRDAGRRQPPATSMEFGE